MIYFIMGLLTLVNIGQFIYLKKQLDKKSAQPTEVKSPVETPINERVDTVLVENSTRSMFSVLYGQP